MKRLFAHFVLGFFRAVTLGLRLFLVAFTGIIAFGLGTLLFYELHIAFYAVVFLGAMFATVFIVEKCIDLWNWAEKELKP